MKYKLLNYISHYKEAMHNLESIIKDKSNSVFVHNVGEPPRHIREDFILNSCKGKSVLHFGFADAPFTKNRLKSNEILHIRIKKVAKSVFGADINSAAIDEYRKATKDLNNAEIDITKKIDTGLFKNQKFDVILLGEIVEHLDNPVQALQNLKEISAKVCTRGSYLLITVPSAFSFDGQVAAYHGYEIVHPDHLYYFSPVTIKTLLRRAGFRSSKIFLYRSPVDKKSRGISSAGVIAKSEIK
ncbi:class I SAM-dependent methyltransferase [bacterium]|nr:class I SAM-dependent methyltransferase [bacterium]